MKYKLFVDTREPHEFDLKITRAFLSFVKDPMEVPDIVRVSLPTSDYLFAEVDNKTKLPEYDSDGYIIGTVAVERKCGDFTPNLMQDVLSKTAEMTSKYPRSYLFVEGSSYQMEEKWRLSRRLDSYHGFIASLCEMGCPPLFLEDDIHFCHVLAGTCIKSIDGKDRQQQYIRPIKKQVTGETVFIRLLAAFSGINVGQKKALILAQHYGGNFWRLVSDLISDNYPGMSDKERIKLGLPKLQRDKMCAQLFGKIPP